MKFYRIEAPSYASDQMHDRVNAIEERDQLSFPGLICPTCGETWATNRLTTWPLPLTNLGAFRGWPIPLSEWRELRDSYVREVGLPEDVDICPGDSIGTISVVVKKRKIPDIIHPWLGPMVLTARVVNILRDMDVTGASFLRISAEYLPRINGQGEVPELYQMAVAGQAKCMGDPERFAPLCDVCGRTESSGACFRGIDPARWDGSDIFHVSGNMLIVYVTQRVRDALVDKNIGNVVFKLVGDKLTQ